MADGKSDIRVLYICGLGSNVTGTKPSYMRQHFQHVTIPSVKHASYSATKEALAKECNSFKPDIVVAHSAGVGKAVTLATTGTFLGPLVLLAGGNGCAPVSDMTGRAVTLVVPSADPDAAAQKRALRSALDTSMVCGVDVEDKHDLNKSMVEQAMLRKIIEDTYKRHTGAVLAPAVAVDSAAKVETPVKEQVKWIFSEWDLNDDGLVTGAEFKESLATLCDQMSPEDVETVVQIVDKNKDGQVDVDEFLEWVFSGAEHAEKVLAETAAPAPPEPSTAKDGDAEAEVTEVAEAETLHEPAAASPEQPPAAPSTEPEQAEASAETAAEAPAEPSSAEPAPAPPTEVGAETEDAADLPAAPFSTASCFYAAEPGQLYTWGRGSDGQLGQEKMRFPSVNCALPYPIPRLNQVVHVSCGGGQQGCTGAVTADGALYTFGNNFKGRLGHGDGPNVTEPRRVEALASERVLMAAFGSDHGSALVGGGRVFLWGSNRYGQLGRGHADKADAKPKEVALPAAAVQIDCEDQYSAALLEDGRLFTWGSNGHGRLGHGTTDVSVQTPTAVAAEGVSLVLVSLGSLYAGAVGSNGELVMWGYGGHGNLGLGDRAHRSAPAAVVLPEPARHVACTRGQAGCKDGLNPKEGGHEGPHTVVVGTSGAIYTMGTCHKGLLANLGSKDGAFGRPWDELKPYRVGGPLRNGSEDPPMSPLAVWPPPYDAIGPVTSAVSAHIHAAVVCADGKAWAWGCGSNDGRCGVERFLNKKGDGKPPEVDMMKCYMMGPHRIGVARPLYWKHPSLQGMRVLMLATGRNHMAGIAVPAGD